MVGPDARSVCGEAEVADYFTPYRYGRPILEPSGEPGAFDRLAVDHARVFVHGGRAYMMYLGFDGESYQTALASSDDMLHWERHGIVFARGQSENAWDREGRAISCFLRTPDLWQPPALIRKDGRYWLFYHAYPDRGYEEGAAANGLAWTTDESFLRWNCLDRPVLEKAPDPETWDGGGLYSVWCVPRDGTYWLYYNGKSCPSWPWKEQVGVAFAEDESLTRWRRHDGNPVCRVGDVGWNKYFTCGQSVLWDSRRSRWMRSVCGFDGVHAMEGAAISDDGLSWRTCEKPLLTPGAPGEIDSTHAHKSELVYFKGALWRIYCAVRPLSGSAERARLGARNWNERRCLTIACSKEIKP